MTADIETSSAPTGDAATGDRETPLAACVIGSSPLRIWGEAAGKRSRRSFAKAGVGRFVEERELADYRGDVIVVRSDVVLDSPVVTALIRSPGIVLLSSDPQDEGPVAAHATGGLGASAAKVLERGVRQELPPGLRWASSESLASSYWQQLRKRETPYALRLTPNNLRQTEWRMFMGTYKGATDCVTKWLWPLPAFHATKLCVRLGLTPNLVTALSLVLVIAAFFWFLEGAWGPGLIAAWLMTFLDTVDGKLARITLTSSRFGNAFDHSIDLIHPPFWYVAWGLGLNAAPHSLPQTELVVVLTIILAGYVLQRAVEGISLLLFKIEIHVWRRIDTWFRLITARRNPNLILLTVAALVQRPDLGLVAVAVWTAICFALHLLQLLQAYLAWRQTGRLDSWMAKPVEP